MVHIYIGKGKGKTTAALGLALRAWGFGKKVYVGEFLKDVYWPSGELMAARKIGHSNFVIERFRGQVHPMFVNKPDIKSLKRSLKESLSRMGELIDESRFDVVVLDELLNCVESHLVTALEVKKIIEKAKAKKVELILTGRDASSLLKRAADYVSLIEEIKHPYQKGVFAREGIDY